MIASDSIGLEKGLLEAERVGVQRNPIGRGSVFQTVGREFNTIPDMGFLGFFSNSVAIILEFSIANNSVKGKVISRPLYLYTRFIN